MTTLTLQSFIDVAKRTTYNLPLSVEGDRVVAGKDESEASCIGSFCCYGYSSVSEEEREVNRKAWQVFERVVNQAYNPDDRFSDRVKHFSTRYGLHFEKFSQEGTTPLRVQHVEKACVGGAKIFARDLQILAGTRPLAKLSTGEIENNFAVLRNPFFLRDPKEGIDRVRGGPDSCGDFFYYNPFKADGKRLHLDLNVTRLFDREHTQLPDFPFLDRLTKRMLSLGLEIGEIISAPDADGNLDFYKVYKKIGTGDGLVAYAFKPLREGSKLKPLIAFRQSGTAFASQEDAVETWRNDTDKEIGKMGFEAAREIFRQLFKDPNFLPPGTKLRGSGYSLGDAQLQRVLAEFPEDFDEVVFINGPSVDTETATRFKNQINALPVEGREKLKIHIYRNRAQHVDKGDIADYGGEKHVGWGITNPDFPVYLTEFVREKTDERPLLRVHADCALDPDATEPYTVKTYTGEELQQQLDNSQRGAAVAWYEQFRLSWAVQVVFGIVFGVYSFLKCLLGLFGITFFRSSAPETESACFTATSN